MIDKNEISNLPEAIQEFIDLIIKKMKYRRKVRQEVRQELIGHFEDELKDCKDDKEKEEKAKMLIENFGDVKMLGKLLRRAKKRCRPLWRTAVVRTFQGIGILFALFIIYCIYLIQGVPNVRVDYVQKMEEMVHPEANENLNAAPLFNQAIESFVQEPNIYAIVAPKPKPVETKLLIAINDKNWPDELTDDELKALKKWVKDNSKTIELYKQASLKPYCWWDRKIKEDESIMHLLLPELSKIRNITKMMHWSARLKAYNDNVEDSINDIVTIYRVGEHFKGPRTIIEQLVGYALQALAVDVAFDILAKKELSSDILQKFQNDFTKVYDKGIFVMDFKTERFFFMDFIQRCYTDDGRGSGKMSPRGLKQYTHSWGDDHFFSFTEDDWTFGMQYLGASLITADRETITEMVNYYYDSFEEYAKLTPWQSHSMNLSPGIDISDWSQIKRLRYWPIAYFLPALKKASLIVYRSKVHSQALITVIAIKRYKQSNGEYPETFEQLVKEGLIKEVPLDPYSDSTLVYKKTDDNFILYSIGEDFEDDGGILGAGHCTGKPMIWAEDGDAVFWPVQKN